MEKVLILYKTHKNNQPFNECIFTSTRLKENVSDFESKTKINDKKS